MAQKADLIKARKALLLASERFLEGAHRGPVEVYESSSGHLQATVVSDHFKGMGVTHRQDFIWDYLRKNVEQEELLYCFGVHPMDLEEYEEASFPQSPTSGSLSLFTNGSALNNDDNDE